VVTVLVSSDFNLEVSRMKSTSLRVVVVVLLAAVSATTFAGDQRPAAASGQVHVIRDASGRVQSRITVAPDGSREVTSHEYWNASRTIARSSSDTVDATGRLEKRTSESFDRKGRVRERRSVHMDARGVESGTLIRFDYDAAGRAREHVLPVGR
jgi:hypothetical protein